MVKITVKLNIPWIWWVQMRIPHKWPRLVSLSRHPCSEGGHHHKSMHRLTPWKRHSKVTDNSSVRHRMTCFQPSLPAVSINLNPNTYSLLFRFHIQDSCTLTRFFYLLWPLPHRFIVLLVIRCQNFSLVLTLPMKASNSHMSFVP